MQVLINIPDDVYKNIRNGEDIKIHYGDYIVIEDKWASEIIRTGTPLPEGHNILDEKKVVMELVYGNLLKDDVKCGDITSVLKDARIIEADKEREE